MSEDARLPVAANWLAGGAEKTDPEQVMDEITPITRPVPTEWLEALARSDAELAAGLTLPAKVVHRRIKGSIARIEERRSGGAKHEPVPAVD